jgi:tRNA G18 (ribose-2'-O)-methylase SpoU
VRQLKPEELNRLSAEEARKTPKLPFIVVLDHLRSAFNVGSFFRTADAFGLEKILLCGFSPVPPHHEIRKAALGAEDVVAWQHFDTVREAAGNLPPHYLRIALEQTDQSVSLDLFKLPPVRGIALFVGNEVHGLSPDALSCCQIAVEIPQRGFKHSLNVAVAGGIAIWHFYTILKELPIFTK